MRFWRCSRSSECIRHWSSKGASSTAIQQTIGPKGYNNNDTMAYDIDKTPTMDKYDYYSHGLFVLPCSCTCTTCDSFVSASASAMSACSSAWALYKTWRRLNYMRYKQRETKWYSDSEPLLYNQEPITLTFVNIGDSLVSLLEDITMMSICMRQMSKRRRRTTRQSIPHPPPHQPTATQIPLTNPRRTYFPATQDPPIDGEISHPTPDKRRPHPQISFPPQTRPKHPGQYAPTHPSSSNSIIPSKQVFFCH